MSPRLRELLYLDYPYPAAMDDLPARSSEGTRSKRALRQGEKRAREDAPEPG